MRAVIADLNIEFITHSAVFARFFQGYTKEGVLTTPDLIVKTTIEEIDFEKEAYFKENKGARALYEADEKFRTLLDGYLEYIVAHRNLALQLYQYDAFLLHASAICCDGKGICFCAKSGTGKTTHSRLWQKRFGQRFFYVNGDKPILRKIDGKFYLYGTPWAGKENDQTNCRVPLHAICLLKRGEIDTVKEITKDEAFFGLMNQILHPVQEEAAMKTLDLVQEAIAQARRYELYCTPTEKAVEVAKVMLE